MTKEPVAYGQYCWLQGAETPFAWEILVCFANVIYLMGLLILLQCSLRLVDSNQVNFQNRWPVMNLTSTTNVQKKLYLKMHLNCT